MGRSLHRLLPPQIATGTYVILYVVFRRMYAIRHSLADKRAGTRFQNGLLVVYVFLLLHVDHVLFFQLFHRVRPVPVQLQAHQVHPPEAAHADRGDPVEVDQLDAKQFRMEYLCGHTAGARG